MSSKIYLEGGGDSKELHSRCRAGFRKLLESTGYEGTMPQLIACGTRDDTYNDFKTAHTNRLADYVGMLVDSEDPVEDQEKTWAHLKDRDDWEKPDGCDDEQVLFMSTCMETWIVSDPDSLKNHYIGCLQESALPSLHNIENRHRHNIQDSLKHATSRCTNAYQKNKRSFEVLGKLNPTTLETNLVAFERMKRILKEKLP